MEQPSGLTAGNDIEKGEAVYLIDGRVFAPAPRTPSHFVLKDGTRRMIEVRSADFGVGENGIGWVTLTIQHKEGHVADDVAEVMPYVADIVLLVIPAWGIDVRVEHDGDLPFTQFYDYSTPHKDENQAGLVPYAGTNIVVGFKLI